MVLNDYAVITRTTIFDVNCGMLLCMQSARESDSVCLLECKKNCLRLIAHQATWWKLEQFSGMGMTERDALRIILLPFCANPMESTTPCRIRVHLSTSAQS